MNINLINSIQMLNKSKDYDCLLMFSGGKDSSYLLYYLSQELGLRVVTFTLAHKFLPKETRENIETFAKKYSKKHISIENNYLNYSGNHFLETWINKPDEESLITLCTGCRLGLVKLAVETAKKEKINIIVNGVTPFESTDYRWKLVNYPKGKEGILFFFLGYLRLILRNPSLIRNPKVLKIQVEEFYNYSNQHKIYRKNSIHFLKPFYDYLKYDEGHIIETLNKLNWQKASGSGNSYWRADCDMNTIKHFFYNRISGYNEQAYYYGNMLKANLITREYYDRNLQSIDQKESIIRILKSSGINEGAMGKYERYLGMDAGK